jgi:hypothetical protein
MVYKRLDNELPEATEKWGWKYHHLGIPTDRKMPGETYFPDYKFYYSGFDTSPYGVEWMRYEEGSPVDKLIQSVPHLAFEVTNLDEELKRHNFKLLTPPNSPSDNVLVAMIEHNGAPIELIEFKKQVMPH